jgi:hypothetical protein
VRNRLWNAALAATLVAAVAGLSVSMLRDAAQQVDGVATVDAPTLAVATPVAMRPSGDDFDAPAITAAPTYSHSPTRYVTPLARPGAATPGIATVLRTQLADYIVAHSAYSTPLLRRNVLSELVTGEEQAGIASSYPDLSVAAHGFLAADASR